MLSHEYPVLKYLHAGTESDENGFQPEKIEEKLRQIIQDKYGNMAKPVIEALERIKDLYQGPSGNGTAPVLHALRVTWLLLEWGQYVNSKVCIAALLHHAWYEGLLTSEEIEQKFGAYVLKLVQSIGISFCCTRYMQEDHVSKQQQWQTTMRGSHEVRTLRVFDDLENILTWQTIPPDSPARADIAHWWEDVCEMSVPLAHATNIQAYNIMRQAYEKRLK